MVRTPASVAAGPAADDSVLGPAAEFGWQLGQSAAGAVIGSTGADGELAAPSRAWGVGDQLERQQGAAPAELKAPRARRASLVDPHVETIQELLARYPKITVQRIWEELRDRGYRGGYSILCERVGQLRPSRQTPWIERFETGPGVQAQMDYAVYTLDFTQEGRRRVNLFSLILVACWAAASSARWST